MASDILLNAGIGDTITANAPVLGTMSGTNNNQLATQSYVDANSLASTSSALFPVQIQAIQLGTPTSPIGPGQSYTYQFDLGGQYGEVAITNFGWIQLDSVLQNEPGVSLGRSVFSMEPRGGILVATLNPGSGGWTRGFVMSSSEYQDGNATPVPQVFFGGGPSTIHGGYTNCLGYGVTNLQTPFDNTEEETTPPAALEISDAFLTLPVPSGNSFLNITIKNVSVSSTYSLPAYFGLSGISVANGNIQQSAVAGSNFMVVTDTNPANYTWISEDAGNTFTSYAVPISAFNKFAGPMTAWNASGVNHVAILYGPYGDSIGQGYVFSASDPNFVWNVAPCNLFSNSVFPHEGNYQQAWANSKSLDIKSFGGIVAAGSLKLYMSANQFTSWGSQASGYTDSNPVLDIVAAFPALNIQTPAGADVVPGQVPAAYVRMISSTVAFAACTCAMMPVATAYPGQVLVSTADGGNTWNLSSICSQVDFLWATDRYIYISDNGQHIYVAVIGGESTQNPAFPYASGTIHFNSSSDGGSTWTYATGAWSQIASNALDYLNNNNDRAHIGYTSIEQFIYASTGSIVIVARENGGTLCISHSSDQGATWSALTPLSAFLSLPGAAAWTGKASDANDQLAAYVSYTNNFYQGASVTTFTNWPCFAR